MSGTPLRSLTARRASSSPRSRLEWFPRRGLDLRTNLPVPPSGLVELAPEALDALPFSGHLAVAGLGLPPARREQFGKFRRRLGHLDANSRQIAGDTRAHLPPLP